MWDVGRKYDWSIGDVSDSRRQRGRSERRQRKVRRRGRTFFRKNVEISNGGLRLQLELIKVQVAFFMQFAQKGGKGYEYDII